MLLPEEQWTFPSRYDQIDHIPAHLLNKLPEKISKFLTILWTPDVLPFKLDFVNLKFSTKSSFFKVAFDVTVF